MYKISLKRVIVSTILAGILIGCSSDDDDDDDLDVQGGTSMAPPVDEAIGNLETALNNNAALTVLPLIDHAANAAGAELELPPTSLQLFGNPALGTPLMQVNQMAGIDLPQKILAWQDATGNTLVANNSVDYLRRRHSLAGNEAAENSLATMSSALNNLVNTAQGNITDGTEPFEPPLSMVGPGEGILTVISTTDMDTTYNSLIAAITGNEALTVVAEVDHAANAQSVGLALDPTRLVIFGNPAVGTPLMQVDQTIGIDLPQKMLVFENAGVVTVAYNDPAYLIERHGITGVDVSGIATALAGLANAAAGIVTP